MEISQFVDIPFRLVTVMIQLVEARKRRKLRPGKSRQGAQVEIVYRTASKVRPYGDEKDKAQKCHLETGDKIMPGLAKSTAERTKYL